MKTYTAANLAAIAAGRIVQRDFLTVTVRDAATNAPEKFHFWSDVGTITAQVYDPDQGVNESRTFKGAGALIEMTPVARVATLTVQEVTVTMSALQGDVESAFRNYNARQAKIEVYRAWFDPESRQPVSPAEPEFHGFCDSLEIVTGDDGQPSVLNARCVPIAQQMTRYNPETRSDEYQRVRNASDGFFKDASTVKEWELFWGQERIQPEVESGNDINNFLA